MHNAVPSKVAWTPEELKRLSSMDLAAIARGLKMSGRELEDILALPLRECRAILASRIIALQNQRKQEL